MGAELIALICEGGAEKAILTLLLDNDKLKYTWNDLLKSQLFDERSASKFADKHLGMDMSKKVHIIRVLDSRKEKFKLARQYQQKVSRIDNLYTRPEIEVLYLINEDKYDDFERQKNIEKKPSLYISKTLHIRDAKKPYIVTAYWSDRVDELVAAIKEYATRSSDDIDQTLAALLK
ncbi:hypothetical protein PQ472_10695 [Lacticaseibacillus pabuli]|uniref:Uncharacterized protein n=1 Tax=Lacticaseibacillus pabuli TaxID=3025672 RepID=A0ABY7WTH4_9LACO|nr:hypothetical protein [Lacticaseibacillus sp. KACC 23028]WDF82344.1 hypothetical protein PQ472_10695 [Lacticaseibacillus sp. KACC 23028]